MMHYEKMDEKYKCIIDGTQAFAFCNLIDFVLKWCLLK